MELMTFSFFWNCHFQVKYGFSKKIMPMGMGIMSLRSISPRMLPSPNLVAPLIP